MFEAGYEYRILLNVRRAGFEPALPAWQADVLDQAVRLFSRRSPHRTKWVSHAYLLIMDKLPSIIIVYKWYKCENHCIPVKLSPINNSPCLQPYGTRSSFGIS